MTREHNPFRIAFFFAVLIALLGVCSYAAADCEGGEGLRKPLTVDGVDGVWVELQYLGCITEERALLRSVALDYERLHNESKARIKQHKSELQRERVASDRATASLRVALEHIEDNEPSPWSPVLWFAGGVVVTSLAVVAIGAATK